MTGLGTEPSFLMSDPCDDIALFPCMLCSLLRLLVFKEWQVRPFGLQLYLEYSAENM